MLGEAAQKKAQEIDLKKADVKKTRTKKNTECTGFCALITKIAEKISSMLNDRNNIILFFVFLKKPLIFFRIFPKIFKN